MSPIGLIHSINSLICLCIGFPLNFLLLLFILRYTDKEMRLYSRLLLQTCIADMLYLVLAELIQQIYLVVDGIGLILMNGPICPLGNPLGNIVYILWNFLFFFSVIGLAAQFVYRYLILCRQVKRVNVLYFLILSAVIAIDAFVCVWLEIIFFTQPHPEYLQNEHALAILRDGPRDAQKWPVVAFTNNANLGDQLWLACYWGVCFGSYLVMFGCAMKIRAFINKNLVGAANKRKLRIQKQISKTLLLQALIPGMILFTILFGAPLGYFADGTNNSTLLSIEMLLSAPLDWLPILNPLVTIWTIKAYRRSFFRIFFRREIAMTSTGTTLFVKNSAAVNKNQNGNNNKNYDNNWI